jgi:O-antigen/teichoic acid export membrane protein
MRRQLVDTALAQTIALLWLGFLAAGVVAWIAYRVWRRWNPPPPPVPERRYSQRLTQRLARHQGAGKRKRRSGPANWDQGHR